MTDLPVLCRPRSGAVLAGVCAGIARRYRIDPTIVRVLMIALCFAGGFGVALYLAGVVAIPRETTAPAPLRRLLPFTANWPPIALWLAAAAALMVVFGAVFGWRSVGFAPVVIIAVVAFALTKNGRTAAPTRTAEPTPFERAADAWQQRVDAHRQGIALPATGDLSALPPQPPLPVPALPDRRGHGWAIALSLMAVGIGVLAIIMMAGVPVPGAAFVAAVTLSLGVGLLASVRRGRPRGMTALAVLACVATVIAYGAETPAGARFIETSTSTSGQAIASFADVNAIPATLSSGAGDFVYDFSAVDVTRDVSTTITMSMGNLTIIIPEKQNVQVDWSVRVGDASFQLPGDSESDSQGGIDTNSTLYSAPNEGKPILHLTVILDVGHLEIRP